MLEHETAHRLRGSIAVVEKLPMYLADEVMVMKDGAVIEAGDSERLYREPREDYTRSLIGAIPRGLVTSGS